MSRINPDIFIIMMALLPTRDLLSVQLVNSTFYWEAANLLAARADFTHKPLTARTVPSYAQFISRDMVRGNYLKHFNVQFWEDVPPELASQVAYILSWCFQIVSLRLTQCESLVTSQNTFIVGPVLAIRGLTEVCFEDVGPRWISSVCDSLQTPLLRATVMFVDYVDSVVTVPDATGLLPNCALTIQHMTTNGKFNGLRFIYPSAMSLRLMHDDMRDVGVLIDAFPTVERLCIKDQEGDYLMGISREACREVRARNVVQIAARVPEDGSWPVGDNARFVGRARTLYLLGLTNIPYIELDAKDDDFEDIQVALQDAAPMDLDLRLSSLRTPWDSLAQLSCGGNLNVLELCIILDSPPIDVDRVVPSIIAMCQREPVANLHLAFEEVENSIWWMWLTQIDMHHLARVLANEIAGLAQVHITAGRHRNGEWQVVQIPGGFDVEELPVGHRDRWL
ncbi:hypothetical protein CERSUDRAFT_97554 [Gelatoporia subvermispora B]|uniref:F-box domain-containing protein n=1 Tax=Ceriporiopsis subvermispora (strain B) TaxID=914234 RepID=M2QQ38_CERS8|nr:hypothetical protein CERSUDRAFT_97554 [Gelatoporia subvermispora B]